ncbi:N-acetylmuramoyl-L-alanine amidase family protein [Deinococcus yavapaiensis]|uniref:N-acetylmuramoyl-L-alanine amidase family protein n=1 Tax=Deinococcus yavapaiensis TaxID=309889 RepID=UPI001FE7F473|nr:N-acetylmuramoyl-L-alanine amidase [Deinococcus yavapaiensis]
MKRHTSLLLASLLIGTFSLAAPRIGNHDGFTRVVFDLPSDATATTKVLGRSVSVQVGAALKSERGSLRTNDVTAYDVQGGTRASTVTLTVASGRKVNAFVIPAKGSTPARLVVDVGTNVDRSASEQSAAVVRPAALGAPVAPRLKVVLDPGHGGIDNGMVGFVMEKEVTLDVSQRVREKLRAAGIDVVMTRDRDTQLSVNKPVDLNMRANLANVGTVNAYVSIHVNASTSSSAQGIETWVFGQLLDSGSRAVAVRENGGGAVGERVTRESANIAQSLLGDLIAQSKLTYSKKLASMVQRNLIASTGATNRGIGTAPFAVIRETRTPAILIELGFGSHPVEGRKLGDSTYRDTLATAIANAIAEFLHAK